MVILFHLFRTKTDMGPDKGILNIGLYACALTLALRVPPSDPYCSRSGRALLRSGFVSRSGAN